MATKIKGNGDFNRREMLKTVSSAVCGAVVSVPTPAVLRAQARPRSSSCCLHAKDSGAWSRNATTGLSFL